MSIQWSVVNLLEDAPLKKPHSPSAISYQLLLAPGLAVGLHASLLHAGTFSGLALHGSFACCPNHCEFLPATALLCWEKHSFIVVTYQSFVWS